MNDTMTMSDERMGCENNLAADENSCLERLQREVCFSKLTDGA